MPDLRNYIGTENPFKLAEPPAWWLQMLYDYDSDLVVFPSRLRMAYILARRRHFSSAFAELDQMDKAVVRMTAGMDGDIMAQHNLIYVRHLIGETIRRVAIFQWLRDHDIKAKGGAEKFDNLIISEEEYRARANRAKMEDDIDHRARDAWRSYQARTGRRAGVGKSQQSAQQMPVSGFTPRESPLAIFTGR